MNETLKAIIITIALLIIAGLSIGIAIISPSYKVDKFCEERNYSSYELVYLNEEGYFNCCNEKEIMVKDNYYKKEKDCIAGGVIPKVWRKVGD